VIGADKPDPEIYRRAVKLINLKPNEVIHVGGDSQHDWEAATAAGLSVFRLDRKRNSPRDLPMKISNSSNAQRAASKRTKWQSICQVFVK
jgi:FMN phosphatase YigB (HAD superfamily)